MKEKYIYAGVTALISILFGVMFAIVPFAVDDLWFLENSTGDFGSWERFITTWRNCLDHLNWDTGRFANLITAPFLSVIPKWLSGMVSGTAVWIIFMSGPAITRCGWISVGSAAWVAAFTFVFPWINYLFLVVYVSNYVWALALGLTFLYIFFRRPDLKGLPLILSCILAYFVGWWHEGQSVPLFIGLCVFLVSRWKYPIRQQVILLFFLGLGILTLVCMPAFWKMTGFRESYLIRSMLRDTIINLSVYLCLFYLFLGALVVAVINPRYRKKLYSDKCLVSALSGLFVFGVISFIIAVRYFNGARTTAFLQMYSMLGVIAIAHCVLKSIKWIDKGGFALVSLAALINLSVSIPVQRKLTAEFDTAWQLGKEALARGEHFVFFDYTPVRFGIDLMKPTYLLLNTYDGMVDVIPVPSVYGDFSLQNSEYRSCQDSRLFLYRNNLVGNGYIPSDNGRIEVLTQDGQWIAGRVRHREFVTAEGDSCSAILPNVMKNTDIIITDARYID